MPNPISLISRWKIFDNLRRSVVEPATVLLLLLGWTLLPGSALYWTLVTLLILFVPPVGAVCLCRRPRRAGAARRG